MKSIKMALLYGLLVWVIPFGVTILIWPWRASDRSLFESIVAVVVVATSVWFAGMYFRKVDKNFFKEGVALGILWLLMALVIDVLIYVRGPLAMPFFDYLKDVGLTYLIIPAIAIGFGCLLGKRAEGAS